MEGKHFMDSVDDAASLFAVLMAFKVQQRGRGLARDEHRMIVINKFTRKQQWWKSGNGKAGSHAVDFENDCVCNRIVWVCDSMFEKAT